ncbi:methylmalonyl Co-A mutase-associated GTPase MeaB [uncultured Kordia sp.]|uniref:methylmalonyl Co-A mutase-associated GTPase MeaB n=1 Tax=uncultured Kordia sp. TaxID=507699 RepID=UPI0026307E3C|nr:methylmalonyl Co-A mutase-associated GTPase MeaB [uncultured Kordia sp.]
MNSKSKHTSALHEKDGISQPDFISKISVASIKKNRRKQPSVDELVVGILNHDKVALSRAITLIESKNTKHLAKATEIIEKCLPHANNSIRIGITGVPGVGKSTFIEAFGKYLTGIGKKVAVLAVDPSSSISSGSILGDKTRMEDLVKDENAFIRPSASGDSLGGVARKTRETIILCEACGFDTIVIETVGVGQSETAVHSMVDFFLLLKLAGAGDELQGIKRGIIEMADAIVINKADGDNVKRAQMARTEFKRALHLYPQKASEWLPKVVTASALKQQGIDDVWQMIEDFQQSTKANDYFENHRKQQNRFWLLQTIEERLKHNFYNNENVKNVLDNYLNATENSTISPFNAAQQLLKLLNS